MNNRERLILTTLMLSIGLAGQVSSQPVPYGVVYGSDRGIQQAQWEIEQLSGRLPQYRNLNYLFRRGEYYVSVIVFPSQIDANNALPIIDNQYRRGSFVVPLNEWCRPNWRNYRTAINGINYYDCGN
jgi:hypothetical protein